MTAPVRFSVTLNRLIKDLQLINFGYLNEDQFYTHRRISFIILLPSMSLHESPGELRVQRSSIAHTVLEFREK
jgi:hypothetical protein